MEQVVMGLFSKRNQTLFNAARTKVTSLSKAIDKGHQGTILEKNKWFQIVPNDPKSPMLMGMGTNKHLIFYPAHSTPYLHSYEESYKFVEILSGEIWDKLTGNKYETGDRFKIPPGASVQPYTKTKEAYLRVCVSAVDTIWDNICT